MDNLLPSGNTSTVRILVEKTHMNADKYDQELEALLDLNEQKVPSVVEFAHANGKMLRIATVFSGIRLCDYPRYTFTVRESCRLILDLASIHRAGWRHGDVSAKNILVRDVLAPNGEVVYRKFIFIDFGNATRRDPKLIDNEIDDFYTNTDIWCRLADPVKSKEEWKNFYVRMIME